MIFTTPQQYAQLSTLQHRRDHSQFFTPPSVANAMADWVAQSPLPAIHDPALGLGAFYQAIRLLDSSRPFSAHEIDPTVLAAWDRTTLGSLSSIAQSDYLADFTGRHLPANIICNPPYARYQRFPNRASSLRQLRHHTGISLDSRTNASSAFLIKAIAEAQPPARIAFLMPLEFLDTAYGGAVKKILIQHGHLAGIYAFPNHRSIFPDAVTSAGIILYDTGRHIDRVAFHQISDPEDVSFDHDDPTSAIALEQLDPTKKWLHYCRTPQPPPQQEHANTVADYAQITRGIATGNNAFFLLRRQELATRSIPATDVHPCITNTRQINQPVFETSDLDDIDAANAPIHLFNPRAPLHPASKLYLQHGKSLGVHLRHIPSHRHPWYAQERRTPPDMLVSTFFRGSPKIILNLTNALHLTAFHSCRILLPYRHIAKALFLYLHSSRARASFQYHHRTYGNQLLKFEPHDFAAIPAPGLRILESINPGMTHNALETLRETRELPDLINRIFA